MMIAAFFKYLPRFNPATVVGHYSICLGSVVGVVVAQLSATRTMQLGIPSKCQLCYSNLDRH